MEFLYFLCVDFMIVFANLLGITYRDANIIILFIFLPSVIFLDLCVYLHYKLEKICKSKKMHLHNL